jgi:hypothetical protein
MTNSDGNASSNGSRITQVVGIAQDGVELIRQELRLARQETIEKVTPAARSTGMIVGGATLAVYGSAHLSQVVIRVLETFMPRWLAALLSGLGLVTSGLVLARSGVRQLQSIDLVPHKTINSLREDKEWLQHQIKSRLI